MISSLQQHFCPFSHDLKKAYQNYRELPLCAKIQVIAFSAFAAISSIFLLGILAVPAFRWSVQTFSPIKQGPEDEVGLQTAETAQPVRQENENGFHDLFALKMLEGRNWSRLDLLQVGNDLERSFRLLSNPHWMNEALDPHAFIQGIQLHCGGSVEDLKNAIRRATIQEIYGFATFFVKMGIAYTGANMPADENGHISFAYCANQGLVDAWIIRARELVSIQMDA